MPLIRQPARFRNHYRKSLTRSQRRNRWLLYAGLALLTLTGNRYATNCSRRPASEPAGKLVLSR